MWDLDRDMRIERNQRFRDLEWEVEEAEEKRAAARARRNQKPVNLSAEIEDYFSEYRV